MQFHSVSPLRVIAISAPLARVVKRVGRRGKEMASLAARSDY